MHSGAPGWKFDYYKIENGGGIQVNKNRLFATKEAAEESIPKAKPKPVVAQQRGYRSPYDYWH